MKGKTVQYASRLLIIGRGLFSMGVLTSLLWLGACTTRDGGITPVYRSQTPAPASQQYPDKPYRSPGTSLPLNNNIHLRPPHIDDRKVVHVALLLPFSARQGSVRKIANALSNAAQLALFEFRNPDLVLLPKDTAGRPDGARGAAEEAVREGAEIILGPLFSSSVRAVAPIARAGNIPVIAFSTDINVSGDGVYLLSFLPEQDVARVIDYSVSQGLTVFTGLVPRNEYGSRMQAALEKAVLAHTATLHNMESYPASPRDMFEPAKRLALYDLRKEALQEERTRLTEAGDPDSLAALEELEQAETFGDVPYEAVLIPAGGNELKSIAPLLPYFDVDPRKVRFLGTGLWEDAATRREPSLLGGWYAAPPGKLQQAFSGRYQRIYGRAAPRIASLGYDAVGLVASLARQQTENRFSPEILTLEKGFAGVDGVFRFLPDGTNERGLDVLEVLPNGRTRVLEPAPSRFEPETF